MLHDFPVPPVQSAAVVAEEMHQQRELSRRPNFAINTRNGQVSVVGEYDPFEDNRKPFNIHTVSQ